MTYRAGVSPGAARAFGIEPGEPHVRCDGCGLVQSATKPSGQPYAWLLDGRAVPGWMLQRDGDTRRDFCPKCRDAPPPPPPPKRGRPPKAPEELYSAEHRVRLPRAQLERWQAAAKARGVRLADWTRATLDAEAAKAPTLTPEIDDLDARMLARAAAEVPGE